MKEPQMKEIAQIIFKTISTTKSYVEKYNVEDNTIFDNENLKNDLKSLKLQVLELCKKFPIYK